MGVRLLDVPESGPGSDHETPAERRVADATVTCIAKAGLRATTADDIAREAGISRATLYRVVSGGREALVTAVLGREIRAFFAGLAAELAGHDTLDDLLVAGIGAAMRDLHDHAALQSVLRHDPDLLLPQLAFDGLDPLLGAAAAFVTPWIAPFVDPSGDDPDRVGAASEHLVRIVLSYALHPSDRVDPRDPASLRRLVDHHVLPGVVGPPS